MRRFWALGAVGVAALLACRSGGGARAGGVENAQSCRAAQAELIHWVEALPVKGLAVRGRADLPTATLGGVIGGGHVVDIEADRLLYDGEPLPGASPEERLEQMRQTLTAAAAAVAGPNVPRTLLYLAIHRDTDAQTLRRYLQYISKDYNVYLLFQSPPAPARAQDDSVSAVAEQLRSETDLPKRHAIARAAYAEWARCPALLEAVDGVSAGEPSERWPKLQKALLEALPKCSCSELDAPELGELIAAEQRAGAAAVGALPIDFVRDERCGASLGLTPVQKIVSDIEAFDAEFSGGYGAEAVAFEQVVSNERLLNYLCQALPGETLASLQRERRTFFWKVRGQERCQAWRFEPLAPGSPMGTWRRTDAPSEPLAVHYWQGAEEIRLFGPVTDPASKPTDERTWFCDQDFRMRGIDAQSIQLESGRWYFDQNACEAARDDEAAFPGCVAALAGGPPDPNGSGPATFPDNGDVGHEMRPPER